MKFFKKTAYLSVIVAVVFVCCGICLAEFEFDDLMGRGFTSQWMVINNSGETFGGKDGSYMDVESDILSDPYSDDDTVLTVSNGDPETEDQSLNLLFLLLSQGYGELGINYKSEELDFDVSSSLVELSTVYPETSTPYVSNKEEEGRPEGYDASWSSAKFSIAREYGADEYDTVVQSINFHQNPDTTPSQTLVRPIVISNVAPGTARDEPLILRMTLRDSQNAKGNITAYDRDTWKVDDDKVAGGNHWVFVPLDSSLLIDNKRIDYYLTTEVVNHTSVRYMAVPYDSYGSYRQYPDVWKFDLLRRQGMVSIPSEFYLAPQSHIAPGLVSVFRRKYNINEQNKTPLNLSRVDAPEYGNYDLILNHRVIYGKDLGSYKYADSTGRFNLFEITAFQPQTPSSEFYDNVANITKSEKQIQPLSQALFGSSSVKRDETMPVQVVQHFTVEQNIPGNINTSSVEGMLPLHITFNIPVTLISDREWWNEMVGQWLDSGRIENKFAENYEIFLLTETDGEPNPWNLTQELQSKGVYNNQVKVFYDEERGTKTGDNYSGLVTVSFMVMLMDGTRDGVRPELSIVEGDSVTEGNDFIVIRDGNNDGKWKMTFFIAPSGYKDNPTTGAGGNGSGLSDSGGGGTCNTGISFAFIALLFALKKFERR